MHLVIIITNLDSLGKSTCLWFESPTSTLKATRRLWCYGRCTYSPRCNPGLGSLTICSLATSIQIDGYSTKSSKNQEEENVTPVLKLQSRMCLFSIRCKAMQRKNHKRNTAGILEHNAQRDRKRDGERERNAFIINLAPSHNSSGSRPTVLAKQKQNVTFHDFLACKWSIFVCAGDCSKRYCGVWCKMMTKS